MTAGKIKVGDVKILWIFALVGLLSMAAYGHISTVLFDRGVAQAEMPVSPSRAMPPVGAVALGAQSGAARNPAPPQPAAVTGSSNDAGPAAADFLVYLHLHETRDADFPQISTRANACPG